MNIYRPLPLLISQLEKSKSFHESICIETEIELTHREIKRLQNKSNIIIDELNNDELSPAQQIVKENRCNYLLSKSRKLITGI